MFQLESNDDLGRKLVFPLVKVKTTIGRDHGCDIVLDDVDVSRKHARLYVMGNQIKIRDEDSVNGTYVNNERIQDMVDLLPGSELIIGSNQFFLRHADEEPSQEDLNLTMMLTIDQLREQTQSYSLVGAEQERKVEETATDEDLREMAATAPLDIDQLLENIYHKKISFMAHPSIEVIYGPDKGRKYLLVPGEHQIGRGANCNIRLSDAKISALHGIVQAAKGKIVYLDQGSKNGSILNNRLVDSHSLKHRDVLVLGSTKLKFIQPREAKKNEIEVAILDEEALASVQPRSWLSRFGMWLGVGAGAVALAIFLLILIINRG